MKTVLLRTLVHAFVLILTVGTVGFTLTVIAFLALNEFYQLWGIK